MKSAALPSHLDAIDGLRGIAIALVLAYHCCLVYGAAPSASVFGVTLSVDALTKTGFLGVELFFALSGFCMFYPFARARMQGSPVPSWGSYAYRRAIKIVPSYLVALTAFTLFYASSYRPAGGIGLAYLAHLAFVHPFFPDLFQSISAPLWTIGVEVQFYLIFPLICGFVLRRPAVGGAFVVAIAVGYRLALQLTNTDTDFFPTSQVFAFLDVFGAGMLAAYVVAWYRARPEGPIPERLATALAGVSLVVALCGLVALAQSPAMNGGADFFTWQSRSRLGLSVLLFAIVTTTTLALPQWRRILANRAFTFLALISYNLYLWHLEVIVQSQRVGLALPLAVLGSLAIASAITYLVERPLLALRPSFRPRFLRKQEEPARANAA
jgi:peptidoglycan/LPS O-acetylase OafA/YrhL